MLHNLSEVRSGRVKAVYLKTYIGSCTLLFLMVFIDGLLPNWFDYCEFSFSLFRVKSNQNLLTDQAHYEKGSTWEFSELEKDFCKEYITETLMLLICPGFCENIKKIKNAADYMVLFLTGVLSAYAVGVLLNLLVLKKQGMNIPTAHIAVFLPLFLSVAGIVTFVVVGRMNHYDSTNSYNFLGIGFSPKDYQMGSGMIFQITLIILQAFNSLFAFLFVRKAYNGPVAFE